MGIKQLIKNKSLTSIFRAWMPFLTWSQATNRKTFSSDLMAGFTGAIIVLPQGVAYAMIAGLPPEYGLYTAIIPPIIAGLFGSSLHLISGPTAAISIVVLSVVSNAVPPDSPDYIPAVLTLTVMAGLIQFGLGLARMGTLVNFISHTVVIGFTAGAAILIATSQLKYVLGVTLPAGISFYETYLEIYNQLDVFNSYSISIALVTIFSILMVKKINPKYPAMLIGMAIGSLFCWIMDGRYNGVSLVGSLPTGLPSISMPDLSYSTLSSLIPGAIAVAILGLVEAVSIARAIAVRSGQHISGNQEFIGQGLSNLVGGFFSCYAGSGSFTRSGVNYDSGAKTPFAAIFAAIILLIIILALPGLTSFLPLPAMAGTIILIAWNLIDRHHIYQILHHNKQESAILIVTFSATLIVELEYAIYLGVLLSLLLYLKRTSTPVVMELAPHSFKHGSDLRSIARFNLEECPQLKIIRIDGSIFFGAVDHIQRTIHKLSTSSPSNNILIHSAGINFIDLTGAEMLYQESQRLSKTGGKLSFCAMKNTVKDELKSHGYMDKLGEGSFYNTVDIALDHLTQTMDHKTCSTCSTRIFKQCPPSNGASPS